MMQQVSGRYLSVAAVRWAMGQCYENDQLQSVDKDKMEVAAIRCYRRALKLDRHYLSAWTLMGHEYVEMKNTSAAIGQSSLILSGNYLAAVMC